uniref:CUB domain-containing protein n=1 Tax=Panagrellus redivivus TaxID=6233 RepID=A0A7E4VD68_PANRE
MAMTHICVLFSLLWSLSSANDAFYTIESEDDLPTDYPVTLNDPFIRFDMNSENSQKKHNIGLIYLFNQRYLRFQILGQPSGDANSLSLHFKTVTIDVLLVGGKCNTGNFVDGVADFAINFEKHIVKCGAESVKQTFVGSAAGIDFAEGRKMLEVSISWKVGGSGLTFSISKSKVAFPTSARPPPATTDADEEDSKDDQSFENSSLSLWIIVIVSVWAAIAVVGLSAGIVYFVTKKFRKPKPADTTSTCPLPKTKGTKDEDSDIDYSQT